MSEIHTDAPSLTHAPSITSGTSTASRSTSSRGDNISSFEPLSLTSRLDPELSSEPTRMRTSSLSKYVSDHDHDYWQNSLQNCEKLHFLSHAFGSHTAYQPQQERMRPHMERFIRLEQLQSKTSGRLSPTLSPMISARDLLPPRSSCHILVDAYINTFEKVLRILHIPTFLREYEHFWCQPLNFRALEVEEPFLCKLSIVLALGSTVISDSSLNSASLQNQTSSWISYGKKWLARHMGSAHRSDINMAQILCLISLVRHVHDDDTEHSEGFHMHPGNFDLARIGMQTGFHRDPLLRSPEMPALEVETRRRLWATMVELSLQHSLDEGLPSSLSPESFDCKPPSDITDEELESGLVSVDPNHKLETLAASTILVLLSRTQHLRLQCLHLANSPRASKSYNDSNYLASELYSAHRDNTNVLRDMDKKPSGFQLQLLQTYTLEFIRALHQPFVEQSTSQTPFHYSRKVVMEIAMRVLAWPPSLGLIADSENRDMQVHETDPCASLRIYGQGYLGRVQRQAAVSLSINIISDLEDGVFGASCGASWRKTHSVIHETLLIVEHRVKVSSGAHGRKELLFLAAAEAYIKGLLSDLQQKDVEDAIYQAIDSAVDLCYEAADQRLRR
ncbi:unnamed protein product [Fusarium venenatum]|uniref:Xylanolytic transcriptional activator regulatory domain-containing protein n=2 Tax=Fusarium venenatum TaxID=56646 RepID=A0A2L2TH55_9HYPO|nr:uncharacterized protein FVRRES_10379 [Fusarium venenatum]CEI70302.1 unnamed protein product [Fusarium venenatum]